MKFTEEMRKRADSIWESYHTHPFVKGIGNGSLDVERFKYWLKQDYVYLINYVRVFTLGAAKAPSLSTMAYFSKLAEDTINVEMSMHRKFAAEFGISEEELESEVPAPINQAYTDFMIARGYSGDFADLMAAVLPCTWGFWEIGTRLKETGDTSEKNPYRDFIEMYSSEEITELYHITRDLMDEEANNAPEKKKEHLANIFITSSKFEYLFWEMSYKMEEWPV